MLVLQRFFRFYINASIHVAFAVVSLYLVSAGHLNVLINKNLLGFLFFSTIVCYNFVKYGVEAEKYLVVEKPSHRPIQVISFLAFGYGLFFFFQLRPLLWGYIAFFTFISVLYAIPFLPRSKSLRSLGGLKIFLVALIWTGFTYILPVMDAEIGMSMVVFIRGICRFLLVLVLILPFEIRDLKHDNMELRTLPQRFGVAQTKKVGYALILAYFFFSLFGVASHLENIIFTSMVTLILIVAIYNTNEGQTNYYASFFVEGIPLVMVLLLYGAGSALDQSCSFNSFFIRFLTSSSSTCSLEPLQSLVNFEFLCECCEHALQNA